MQPLSLSWAEAPPVPGHRLENEELDGGLSGFRAALPHPQSFDEWFPINWKGGVYAPWPNPV